MLHKVSENIMTGIGLAIALWIGGFIAGSGWALANQLFPDPPKVVILHPDELGI